MQNSTVGQLVPKLLNALEYAVQRSTRMTGGRELKACRLNINNFRGIKVATVLLPKHAVLIGDNRSEEHTSELQSLMRISYAVFCLKQKKKHQSNKTKSST